MTTETDVNKDLEIEELEDETSSEVDDVTSPADETAYTKEKQQLDFEKANARRAREELATMTEAYEESLNQAEQLKKELENIRSAKTKEENKLEEMDDDLVDEKVKKNIHLLEQRLEAKSQLLDKAVEKIELYEQKIQQDEQQKKNDQIKESVLSAVEKQLEKFGTKGAAKYRNEANKLADELVDTGVRKQPKTYTEAIDLMTDCYLQIKNQKEQKKKSVSVDTGKGGTGAGEKKSGIKAGTLDSVASQMLTDRSWLE